jgi:hypothetical protein
MKRKIAWAWLALCVAAGLFVAIGWLVLPTGEPFWRVAKGLTADIALIGYSVRYIRNHPKPPRKEIDDER